MSNYYATDRAGKITQIGVTSLTNKDVLAAGMFPCVDVADPKTQKHDYSTGKLIAYSQTHTEVWADVLIERNQLLIISGNTLAEHSLPDSFPKMSTSGRQSKIDAVIAYRQALRDITKQPDPTHITWPTPPGAI